MHRREFMRLSLFGVAGILGAGINPRIWANQRILKDCLELDRLGYFVKDSQGQLVLREGIAEKIFDFHTHLGLSFLGGKPIDLDREDPEALTYFPLRGNPIDLDTYAAVSFTKQNKKIAQNESVKQAFTKSGYAGTHTPKNLLKEMDRNRVVKAIILAIDYPSPLSQNSELYLEASRRYPRLIPFVSVHPKDAQMERRVRKLKELGAVGMKVHPPMQLIRANHPRCMALTKLCGELKMPVLFHSGHSDISPEFGKDYPRIEYFWEPVQSQPETTFILAHGGIHFYRELIELAVKNQNVWIELSGQAPDPIKEMLKAGLEDRLLFGSDWPYYIESLPLAKVLLATEGAPKIRQKILFDNAQRLLKSFGVQI